MKVGYLIGLVRLMTGTARLGTLLVQEGFTKRAAVKRFRRVLQEQGLPHEVVNHLTGEYADMVSLNPLRYAHGFRVRVRRGAL